MTVAKGEEDHKLSSIFQTKVVVFFCLFFVCSVKGCNLHSNHAPHGADS